ncbi:HWE histidine kinase domain-containing protein [Pontivivens ytuae]|uniref:histidine kinase n=1 Tax=Pontivivens ytuae TaxID=2789856 RepID=A0A7S9LNN2_9RHOB|nr:HWE histidine kinase domain-containing protein [Pontivivens ytuae]QPH52359.1 GAF domain-containing protein [Pontivivens ytuae]
MPDPQPKMEPFGEVDLTSCDREQIHIPGRIQPFGCLIALDPDWIVSHVSENAAEVLGLPSVDELIGRPLRQFARSDAIHDLRGRMQTIATPDMTERLYGVELTEGGETFDIGMHMAGRTIILELEPHDQRRYLDQAGLVRSMVERLKRCEDTHTLCEQAGRQMRALTGFDRVMVYRFAADDSGEVISESRRQDLEPYLGLRYPASDIPKQARALYTRSLLRIIADVKGETIPVRATAEAAAEPLDMSLSGLRAVSPIHLEYLSNMGVGASMSVSILRNGRLWGLFACHHMTAKTLSYDVRSAAEMFGQVFSLLLEQTESRAERDEAARVRILHDQIMGEFMDASDIAGQFERISEAVRTLLPFDGAACRIDGTFASYGNGLAQEEFDALADFLDEQPQRRSFVADSLAEAYPDGAAYVDRVAGAIALPVRRSPNDYVVFFRKEEAQSVRWAGNPEKPVEVGPNGTRLMPRESFAAWTEEVRGRCSPWTESEQRIADTLRETIVETILRISDASREVQERLQERQDLLIGELNHRVRNILNLISGLVSQSADGERDVSEFTAVLGGRIHALARAHDQVNRKSWEPASLRKLLQAEAEAFSTDAFDRIIISGTDAKLEADAYSTMALVLHELVTNATKYGALSSRNGRVLISIKQGEEGGIDLEWVEIGGPAVAEPLRRGFGSTVIERAVVHELRGTAELLFDPGGVQVRLHVPERHLATVEVSEEEAAPTPVAPQAPVREMRLSGKALVLEDNMIIALDAEELLYELGVEDVRIVATNEEAAAMIKAESFDFAVLDFNLGDQTSVPTANLLRGRNTPVIFATGYGDMPDLVKQVEGAPIIQKPYDAHELARALQEVVFG